ncbi:MAG: hypothetical protein KDA68_08730 [Planctomycetaceae bacterium]|nr:hypothetical protein [Planctomycetaceae bacterium]
MGRGYTQYSYTDIDIPDECVIHSAFLVYSLEDGAQIRLKQADYFCPTCNGFVVGELIESVAEIENEIDQIQNHPDSVERLMAEWSGDISGRIAELRLRIEWRRKRQSPPKCLHCGSSEILPIPREEEFYHPVSDQPMKVSKRGFLSMNEWYATYTPEGDLIESWDE